MLHRHFWRSLPGGGTIGFMGTYQMSFAMVDYMEKGRFAVTVGE